MHAHYFGNTQRPLWGAYHEPCRGRMRDAAVLLCPPIGHEYLRTHWAWRQLALRLAAAGFHVLRFDYAGTGDSGGELLAVGLRDWLSDIHTAAEELRDESAARSLSVVGLRFGATLAALAVRGALECERLVLCDPVLKGSEYWHELRATQERLWSLSDAAIAPTPADVGEEVLGFGFSSHLVREIETTDLTRLERPKAGLVSFVATAEIDDARLLDEQWRPQGESGGVRVVDEIAGWGDVSRLGTALLGNRLIEEAVLALVESAELARAGR